MFSPNLHHRDGPTAGKALLAPEVIAFGEVILIAGIALVKLVEAGRLKWVCDFKIPNLKI